MADKGDVYYCTWHKSEAGTYVGWELRGPALRAEVDSLIDLMSALGDVVGEAYNDNEAAICFDPPLRESRADDILFADGWVSVAWNCSYTYAPSAKTAFAGGRCPSCEHGIGQRSAEPLIIDSIWPGSDGASAWLTQFPGNIMVVSDQFLAQLTDAERACFEARPVQWAEKKRRPFFEVVPTSFVQPVAIRNLELSGARCDQCGYRSFSHRTTLGYGVAGIVSRDDFSEIKAPIFFIGEPVDCHLCMPMKRWRGLRGKPYARNLDFGQVAILDESRCDRDPQLPTREEIIEFRKKHGYKVQFRPNA